MIFAETSKWPLEIFSFMVQLAQFPSSPFPFSGFILIPCNHLLVTSSMVLWLSSFKVTFFSSLAYSQFFFTLLRFILQNAFFLSVCKSPRRAIKSRVKELEAVLSVGGVLQWDPVITNVSRATQSPGPPYQGFSWYLCLIIFCLLHWTILSL